MERAGAGEEDRKRKKARRMTKRIKGLTNKEAETEESYLHDVLYAERG